jgi:hypothetical protein
MASRRKATEDEVRVNFRVALSVNPLLASDLKRFTLGRSRHARLLTLALIGLLSETKTLNGGSPAPNEARPTPERPRDGTKGALSEHDFADIGE